MKKHNLNAYNAVAFGQIFATHAGDASSMGPLWMQWLQLVERAEPLTRGKGSELDQQMIKGLLKQMPFIQMEVVKLEKEGEKQFYKVVFKIQDPATEEWVYPVCLYN